MTDPKERKDETRRVPGPKTRRPVIPTSFQISRVSPMRQILDEAEGNVPPLEPDSAGSPAVPEPEPSLVTQTSMVTKTSQVPESNLVDQTSLVMENRQITETSLVTETSPASSYKISDLPRQVPQTSPVTETSLVPEQIQAWSENSLVTPTSLVPETSPVAVTSLDKIDLVASLPDVEGFLQMPNRIVDHLLPLLAPYSQLVFVRLYRLSWGFGKPFCAVSLPKLAEKTQISQSSVQRAIADLEAKGLIRKSERIFGKSKAQGVVYEVVSGNSPVQETTPGRKTSPVRETSNKYLKTSLKNVSSEEPIYEVRKIAARFREMYHGDPNYSLERLRADVMTALEGQGIIVDERTLAEGLRGITL